MAQVDISKGIVLNVDFDKIMGYPEVVAQAVRFAVRQALTNTHAAIKKDEPDAVEISRALAEKRLEAMYAGSWGQTERGPSGDPVAREMRGLAEAELKTKLRAIGKKFADIKADVWKEIVAKHLAAHDARFRTAAEAKLAIKVESADEDAEDIFAMLDEGEEA